jgi:hypothetical protein
VNDGDDERETRAGQAKIIGKNARGNESHAAESVGALREAGSEAEAESG